MTVLSRDSMTADELRAEVARISGVAKKARRNGAKRRRPEDLLQRAVCQYLDALQSQGRLLYFAVPNGGKRSMIEAAIMKGLGVKAGVPDLCIVLKNGVVAFAELKSEEGRVSEKQTWWLEHLAVFGCPTAIIRTLDDMHFFLTRHDVMGAQ